MWITLITHLTIVVLSWFAVLSIYNSLTKEECVKNCKKLYSEQDIDALSLATMQAIFLVLYLVYGIFIRVLTKYFNISENTEEKVNELHSYNLLTQILVCVYGTAYLLIYVGLMTPIPKILLTTSCIFVWLLCCCLLTLIIVSTIQTRNLYTHNYRQQSDEIMTERELDPCFNLDYFPYIIYQNYYNLNHLKCYLCMKKFIEGDIVKIIPGCFHCLHSKCFAESLKCKRRVFCPVDYKDLTEEEIYAASKLKRDQLVLKIQNSLVS